MKKIFFIVELLLLGLVLDAQVVKQNGKLKVKGTQLVNVRGEPVVLHGM